MSPERTLDQPEVRPDGDTQGTLPRAHEASETDDAVWAAPGTMPLWDDDAPAEDDPGGGESPHDHAAADVPDDAGGQPDAPASGSPDAPAVPSDSSGAPDGPDDASGENDQDDLDDDDGEEELPLSAAPAMPATPAAPPSAPPAAGAGGGEERQARAQDADQPAPPSPSSDDGEEPMTLMGHLNEMRRRLARMVIMVILGFIGCYGVSEPVYAWLSEPLKAALPEGSKLIYTSPQGAFFVYLKVALVSSIFVTSPFSFYQIWAFIAPGLYKEEKQAIAPLAFFSAFFFLAGASFCYFLVFPLAFRFFMGFSTDVIVPMISVEEYLSFALKLLIAFGLVFEMPLFAHFLAKLGVLSPDMMRRKRKYAILLIFVAAAILTPPDVFSQCLMAAPMLLLYEVSVFVAALARKRRDARKAARNASAGEDHAHDKS